MRRAIRLLRYRYEDMGTFQFAQSRFHFDAHSILYGHSYIREDLEAEEAHENMNLAHVILLLQL